MSDGGRARPGYPGERPDHQMQKLARSNPKVTCGTCRQFDQHMWCRRWNYHTAADAPICAEYRVVPRTTGR